MRGGGTPIASSDLQSECGVCGRWGWRCYLGVGDGAAIVICRPSVEFASCPLCPVKSCRVMSRCVATTACPRSGALRARAPPFERAAARVCREAGARVTTHTRVSDLNLDSVARGENRRVAYQSRPATPDQPSPRGRPRRRPVVQRTHLPRVPPRPPLSHRCHLGLALRLRGSPPPSPRRPDRSGTPRRSASAPTRNICPDTDAALCPHHRKQVAGGATRPSSSSASLPRRARSRHPTVSSGPRCHGPFGWPFGTIPHRRACALCTLPTTPSSCACRPRMLSPIASRLPLRASCAVVDLDPVDTA